MTSYFSSIAARVQPSPSGVVDDALARPGPPTSSDRGVLEDPFESVVEEGEWQSSTSDLDETSSAVTRPRPSNQGVRSELPPIAAVDSTPTERFSPPSMVPEPANEPQIADEGIHVQDEPVERTSDAERVEGALQAMDDMLFRAAGMEPPIDLPDPPLTPRPPSADLPDVAPVSETLLPRDDDIDDTGDFVRGDAVPVVPVSTFAPPADEPNEPDPALMSPPPDVVDIEPPASSVNIGRITVEVREPQPGSGPVSEPAETSAPRAVSFPRAQRLLTPQRRRLG